MQKAYPLWFPLYIGKAATSLHLKAIKLNDATYCAAV